MQLLAACNEAKYQFQDLKVIVTESIWKK